MSVATRTTLIPVEEYLKSSYKPACEYIDGVLRQKSMPTYKHGKMELHLSNLINQPEWGFEATPELTVWLRENKYLIPDVAVQRSSELQQPYPTKPIHLCIEILSLEDRFGEVVVKCEDYHAWGVRYCWIIDPEEKQCWEYVAGSRPHQVPADGRLTAREISLSLSGLFAGF
jgi:Uma2 family endonuclease